jgi:hypothetical protein
VLRNHTPVDRVDSGAELDERSAARSRVRVADLAHERGATTVEHEVVRHGPHVATVLRSHDGPQRCGFEARGHYGEIAPRRHVEQHESAVRATHGRDHPARDLVVLRQPDAGSHERVPVAIEDSTFDADPGFEVDLDRLRAGAEVDEARDTAIGHEAIRAGRELADESTARGVGAEVDVAERGLHAELRLQPQRDARWGAVRVARRDERCSRRPRRGGRDARVAAIGG